MRLFVGIDLPPSIRDRVWRHVSGVRGDLPAARWVRSENYHLTLVFLGEMDESVLPKLSEALKPTIAAARGFSLRLCGAGAFPSRRPARVLWIGLEEGEQLRSLQAEVAAALEAAGSARTDRRPYHPHLTVARCSRPWSQTAVRRWRESLGGTLGESFSVTRASVFQSRLTPDGACYEVLQTFSLAGIG